MFRGPAKVADLVPTWVLFFRVVYVQEEQRMSGLKELASQSSRNITQCKPLDVNVALSVSDIEDGGQFLEILAVVSCDTCELVNHRCCVHVVML